MTYISLTKGISILELVTNSLWASGSPLRMCSFLLPVVSAARIPWKKVHFFLLRQSDPGMPIPGGTDPSAEADVTRGGGAMERCLKSCVSCPFPAVLSLPSLLFLHSRSVRNRLGCKMFSMYKSHVEKSIQRTSILKKTCIRSQKKNVKMNCLPQFLSGWWNDKWFFFSFFFKRIWYFDPVNTEHVLA